MQENLSPRDKTFHLIISSLLDVMLQFVEQEVGQGVSFSLEESRAGSAAAWLFSGNEEQRRCAVSIKLLFEMKLTM